MTLSFLHREGGDREKKGPRSDAEGERKEFFVWLGFRSVG